MTDKLFLIETNDTFNKFRLFINANKSNDMQCIFVNYQLTDYTNKKKNF